MPIFSGTTTTSFPFPHHRDHHHVRDRNHIFVLWVALPIKLKNQNNRHQEVTWCKILEVANRSCWSGHLGSDHIRVNFVFRFGLVAILMNQVNIRSVPIGSGHFGQGQLFFLANKFMFVKNISLLFSGRFEFGSLFSRRFEFGSLRVGYIRVMLCRVFTFG